MKKGIVMVALAGLLAGGCASWQKARVRATVVDELDCAAEQAVARGPVEPATEDGPVELGPDEQLFRGSCSVAWDERAVVACDHVKKTCRVVDIGPPRMEPRKPPRAETDVARAISSEN